MSPSWRGFLCLPLIINLVYFLFLDNFSFNNTKISKLGGIFSLIILALQLNSEKVETWHGIII